MIYLLETGTIISWNKNQESPLQLAYKFNQPKAAYEITQSIIKGKSQIDERQKLDLYTNDFIKYLRKNYLDRNIFLHFPAKHTKRANALIDAAQRCSSIKEFKDLLNNQLNLFKNAPVQALSNGIINERWSKVLQNRPYKLNSKLYHTINTFFIEWFSMRMGIKSGVSRALQHRSSSKN